MLRVRIDVNTLNILDIQVLRIKGGTKPSDMNTYSFPNGQEFKHRYGDGAIQLALKMLKLAKEPK